MLIYGLEITDIERIRAVFAADPRILKVIIFGSRAMGNYTQGSDIDLAVQGNDLTFNDILDLQYRLESLGMLYRFDIQDMASIKDADVLQHIDRVGKIFFQ